MRWVFFHGVFGDWGWEEFDDAGQVIAESRACFESRGEAEADAARHGYRRQGMHPVPRVSGTTGTLRSAMAASLAPALKVAHGAPGIHRPPAAERVAGDTTAS